MLRDISVLFMLINFQLFSIINKVMNVVNNNNPDPVSVSVYSRMKSRILERFNRLNQLRYGRLQPLIDRLQPDQRNDGRRSEVRLKREMDLDEALILNSYRHVFVFENEHRLLQPLFSQRTALLQRLKNALLFFKIINCLDNLLQISLTEIERLEQRL